MLRVEELRSFLFAAVLSVLAVGSAEGANPRWTTGPPYFNNSGQIVIWYTDQPLYFTDPGDLSASVNHAAADAMVAAAAGVWNVPSARIVLQQGGILDEQVSGSNVYMGSNGLVFPADVQSANYAAKQIAVVYDRDGSVTDLLLGSGASDPSGCRQNAVTESVDSIVPAGFIQHAVIVLNGRCTGPAPQQQLQMQYQLERVFGRVLGLGWSQLNDNVFMGSPTPTAAQALHWPIMHPIDIICGLYTYQCLPQPFTLRDDDVASITEGYPVLSNPGPGKQLSYSNASALVGTLLFPTQEGMAGVNMLMTRNAIPQQVMEPWDDLSAASGIFHQQQGGNPTTTSSTGIAGSLGSLKDNLGADIAGYFSFSWSPVPAGEEGQDLYLRSEPINPLYTGAYAIAPYTASTVNPSGAVAGWHVSDIPAGWGGYFAVPVPNAASTCGAGGDGTEDAPVAPGAGGWWTGVLCGPTSSPWSFAHTAWVGLPVLGSRSLTVEVTALDEQGLSTANKARPVLGAWSAGDATGTPPTLAAAAVAFNSVVSGMTRTIVQSSIAQTLRIAIADERGDGRPDYNYRARVLYADAIAPATGSGSTQVTITGMGFRPGNSVTVNGVVATVASWTATTIVATIPYLKSVLPGMTMQADVVVTDLSTSGTTVMTGVFTYVYTALPYTLALISAPSGNLPVGLTASPAFSVKAIDVDGVTPMPGVLVVFSAMSGAVQWGTCGLAASCTVVTDANGLASTVVTPAAPGVVTLQAAALGLTQTISFTALPLVRSVTVVPAAMWLAAGSTVNWTETATLSQQGSAATLVPVTWTTSGAGLSLSGTQGVTDSGGMATSAVKGGPLAGGVQATGSVCAWTGVCAGFVVQGVDPSQFVVVGPSGAAQSVEAATSLVPMSFEVTDAAGDPIAGAEVEVHQTVGQWTVACPVQGRCPVAPVYSASTTALVSDGSGMVVVVPMQIAGAEVTNVVVTSGTAGFVSLTLQKHP
ncbi:IPT/TIG domain-containing protein [Granulicella arctica]|uniref:IPT/TIG domain-containing protein n=1 Tax=Granulicella arctica TaxID=940613 RepID=UPI0021DF6A6E|nr:IPT/TIG domain-containing protein [Granulicella arctica]